MNDVTTSTTQASAEEAKVEKAKTVLDDMRSPAFFPDVDSASAYLNKSATDFADFEKHDLIMNGIDAESGEFDPAIYTEGTRILVHVLKNRGKKSTDAKGVVTETPGSVRAIVVTPVPALAQIQDNAQGLVWLDRVINTQLVHQAVAGLRSASDLRLAAKDMPLALDDFVTANRESSSVSETFDKLFRGIIDGFKVKSPAWAKARLIKAELKKAMESAAYALAVYPPLEDRGDKPSMFEMAIQLGIREAKAQGLDPTIFETWLATRNEKKIEDESIDGEESDFDLDDISFGSKDEAEAEVAEGEATEGAAEDSTEATESTEEAPATT